MAEGREALVADEVARRGSLAFRVDDGGSYTYQPRQGRLEIVPGDVAADTVVGLDRASWAGLVHDLESAPGLLYDGRARSLRGDLMRFVMWEPALRALYNGIPIHDPGAPLVDAEGESLDPAQTFRLDDDPEEMTAFMRAAGYILLKNVFSEAEVAALRKESEAAGERAVEGDQKSWWGKTASGEVLLSRVIEAAVLPAMRSLAARSADSAHRRDSGRGSRAALTREKTGSPCCGSIRTRWRGSPTSPGIGTAGWAGTR